MAREERELHNLWEEGLHGEEDAASGEEAEDWEETENHIGYHNFYGY
ncbi:MAG: hypothetical protein ACYC4H_14875 [Desulfocucumaceae bacterium]